MKGRFHSTDLPCTSTTTRRTTIFPTSSYLVRRLKSIRQNWTNFWRKTSLIPATKVQDLLPRSSAMLALMHQVTTQGQVFRLDLKLKENQFVLWGESLKQPQERSWRQLLPTKRDRWKIPSWVLASLTAKWQRLTITIPKTSPSMSTSWWSRIEKGPLSSSQKMNNCASWRWNKPKCKSSNKSRCQSLTTAKTGR